MAEETLYVYRADIIGDNYYQGYTPQGALRETRVRRDSIVHANLVLVSGTKYSAGDKRLIKRIMATAEEVIPSFERDPSESLHSAWWTWGENEVKVSNVTVGVEPRAGHTISQQLKESGGGAHGGMLHASNEYYYDLSHRLVSAGGPSSGCCVLDAMMDRLAYCQRVGVEKVMEELREEAVKLGEGYDAADLDLERDGISCNLIKAWVLRRRDIQFTAYNGMLQPVMLVPRRVNSKVAGALLVLVCIGRHCYVATPKLATRRFSELSVTVSDEQRDRLPGVRDHRLVTSKVALTKSGENKDPSEQRVLRVFYARDKCRQTGDAWLDMEGLESRVLRVGVRTADGGMEFSPNSVALWEGLIGDAEIGSTLVVPEDDLAPLRLAFWQAWGCLCTEKPFPKPSVGGVGAGAGGAAHHWVGTALRSMRLDARAGVEYRITANPDVLAMAPLMDTWEKLGLQPSSCTAPSFATAYLERHLTLPLAGHHPSTVRFWQRYSSSAIRGCVRTVVPEDEEHARLRTVDYRACYLTCLETMGQAVPMCSEDDVFTPVGRELDAGMVADLRDDTWYIVQVTRAGLPFLGLTSCVFAHLLREVAARDPGRSVTVLYSLTCSSSISQDTVKQLASEFYKMSGEETAARKLLVSKWVGAQQTFRQAKQVTKSYVSADVGEFVRVWGETGENVEECATVVHQLYTEAGQGGARNVLLYDARRVYARPMVANQSRLLLQLAVHCQSYLLLWDLERRLVELGCAPAAYATDSITFIEPVAQPGVVCVPEDGGDGVGEDATQAWLETHRALPPHTALRLEPVSKTQGLCGGDKKVYICNSKPGSQHPARAFTHNMWDRLFGSEEERARAEEAVVGGVAGGLALDARCAFRKDTLMVCPPRDWVRVVVGDEAVETTVDRLTALFSVQQSVYLQGMGGSGKTFTIAHLVKRVLQQQPVAQQPPPRVLLTSYTHDGCSALLEAVLRVCEGFDAAHAMTVDAALKHSCAGFSTVTLPYDYVIIDECSMSSPTHLSFLANLMERQPGVKVLWAGDLLQHISPVDPMQPSSNLFRALASNTRVELTVNRRLVSDPRNKPLADALGQCREILQCVADGRCGGDREAEAVVGRPDLDFIAVCDDEVKYHMCVSNHEVKHCNAAVMEREVDAVRRAGVGGGVPLLPHHPANPLGQAMWLYVGLEVVVRRSIKAVGLWNKAEYNVVGVDVGAKNVVLKHVGGRPLNPVTVGGEEGGGAAVLGVKRKRSTSGKVGGVVKKKRVSAAVQEDWAKRLQEEKAFVAAGKGSGSNPKQSLQRAATRVAALEAKLAQAAEVNRLLAGGNYAEAADGSGQGAGGVVVPKEITFSFSEFGAHFAPRYARTSYSVQGRTLSPATVPQVMIHGMTGAPIRCLHVMLGRVQELAQLVCPGPTQEVRCADLRCQYRSTPGYIYTITERSSGKVYVGQTLHKDPVLRYEEHLAHSCNRPLAEAMAASANPRDDFKFAVHAEHAVAPTPRGHIENQELKYYELALMAYYNKKGVVLFNERVDDPNDDFL